jgi:hypothetical protein
VHRFREAPGEKDGEPGRYHDEHEPDHPEIETDPVGDAHVEDAEKRFRQQEAAGQPLGIGDLQLERIAFLGGGAECGILVGQECHVGRYTRLPAEKSDDRVEQAPRVFAREEHGEPGQEKGKHQPEAVEHQAEPVGDTHVQGGKKGSHEQMQPRLRCCPYHGKGYG